MDLPKATNHAPVTVALVASALASIAITLLKAKFGIDFSGEEANITVLATAAGYLVPGLQATLEGTS
jgi:hypothetical protein